MSGMTVPAHSKSAFARWLVAQRKSRPGSGKDGAMTTAELRAALLTSRGFGMGHSTYAALESGSRKPTDEQYRHLTGFFGSEPEPEPTPPEPATSDLSALVAALTEQAEANRQLATAVADLARSMASPGFLTHAAADGMTTTVLGAIENVRGILLSLDPGRAGTPRRGRLQVSPHGTPASSSPARSAPAGEAPPSDG